MIEIDTRLRVARGMGKTKTEAAVEVFATLKRRGHPDAPPPTASDGLGGIREAMVEVYGQPLGPASTCLAAGLTDHIWTVKELLTTLPILSPSNT